MPDFVKIMKDQMNAFEKTLKEKGLKAVLAEVANDALPKLALANNFAARALMGGKIKNSYSDVQQSLKNGKFDPQLQKLSDDLRKLTRAEIKQAVQEKLNAAQDPATAKKITDKHAITVKGMTADEYVLMAEALHAVMPDAMANLHNMLFSGKPLADSTRDYFNMTAEQRAQHHIDLAKKIPVDAIADAAYEMCQKATPAALRAAALDLSGRLSAPDVKEFIYTAMDFVEDLLSTAKKTNTIGVKKQKNATAFGNSLKGVFNAAAGSIAKAGITPDTDIEAAVKKAFQKPSNDNSGTPSDTLAAAKRKKGSGGPKNG